MVQIGQTYPVRVGLPDFWDALRRGDRVTLQLPSGNEQIWDYFLSRLLDADVDTSFTLLNNSGLSVENLEALSRYRDQVLAFKGFLTNQTIQSQYVGANPPTEPGFLVGLTGPFQVPSYYFSIIFESSFRDQVYDITKIEGVVQPSGVGLGFHIGPPGLAINRTDPEPGAEIPGSFDTLHLTGYIQTLLAELNVPINPRSVYIATDPGSTDSDGFQQLNLPAGYEDYEYPSLPPYDERGSLQVKRVEYFGPQGVAGLTSLQPQSVTGISYPTRLEIEGRMTGVDLTKLEVAYVELETDIYRITGARQMSPTDYNLTLSRYLGA